MAGRSESSTEVSFPALKGTTRVAVVASPYYADISAELEAGARAVLDTAGVAYEIVPVPGALEIPQAAAMLYLSGRFDGVIALGCVIRGETSHYDIVVNNANHWLYQVAVDRTFPVGNAILTVDTHAQALARAKGGAAGKGGDAARACLRLIEIARAVEKDRAT